MSYNILGINPFHNGSACVLSDGEIVYFLEEERLSRCKHDEFSFLNILNILDNYKINEIALAGIYPNSELKTKYRNEDLYKSIFRKLQIPLNKFTDFSNTHHLTHAYHAFYNSGFNKAISIVIDGAGSTTFNNSENIYSKVEQDSIFTIDLNSYPVSIFNSSQLYPIPPNTGLGMGDSYAFVSYLLGFKMNEEGKTMGLSSYGDFDPKLPSLFKNNKTNPKYIKHSFSDYPYGSIHNSIKPSFKYDWHKNSKKLTSREKNLAWRIQQDCQNTVKNYIQESISKTGLKNIVCSGGYFLNCVSNYYLTKEFPNVNFYFEPISSDAGTAIGAAYMAWKEHNFNFKPNKQKTLYYGPKYSKEQLLEGIKKYV